MPLEVSHAATGTRPRVEGAREEEILDATVRLLGAIGYDKLTLDAVAAEARASKATLYRRWKGKAELVVDAVHRAKSCCQPPDLDTGSLRGDLLAVACRAGGLTDDVPLSVLGGLISAMHHDPDLTRAIHKRFLGPRMELARQVLERARRRGEISGDVDISLLVGVLPAMVLYRRLVLDEPVDPRFVARVVDEVVLPAATGKNPSPTRK
ncbi:MAG: TetR/AcrR family transcriptional regulator [Jiangellaceae bacterium]|nr:TetR/AcrR family transcriptional regulator [Jiangellaceae bacterium]